MIFLVFFSLIGAVVIILNIMNNSNLEEIENYFKAQNCQNIIYSKGVYKGICDDKIIQISNSFSVDLEKNKTIFKLKDINSLEDKESRIIINNSYSIEFKDKENLEKFYKSLKEKIDK